LCFFALLAHFGDARSKQKQLAQLGLCDQRMRIRKPHCTLRGDAASCVSAICLLFE
jgi:hypothetical protein